MIEAEEITLTWTDIDRFCSHTPGHCKALVDLAMQAGGQAYAEDVAEGRELLPLPSPWMDNRAVPEDEPRLARGKGYAGQLLAADPTKFGYAFPLKAIAHWWFMGYDQAREKREDERCQNTMQAFIPEQ